MTIARFDRAAAAAVALAAMAWVPAHAETLTFESLAPALYLDGEAFVESSYTYTVKGDFGLVDTVAACSSFACPVGNATKFYYGVNDGALRLERSDLGSFGLLGFSAAYLASQRYGAGFEAGKIVVLGKNGAGTAVATASFAFAPSVVSGFPFTTYAGAALAAFADVRSVEFSACSYDAAGMCVNVNLNLSQFALDNVQVVPEPTTWLLWTAGLTGLAIASRRRSAGAEPSQSAVAATGALT